MSAWVLPDHLADVLPSEARHIEELRRQLLDTARGYGYELVMPPLLEHLESLLSGTGQALDLQTFKLVDQLSGRMMGLRADTTPQVARIDAHLLNRAGVARLCYCGPVVHTRPGRPHATREPLQLGAEIYGHSGPEADLESLLLALDMLRAAGVPAPSVDLGDVRIVRAVLRQIDAEPQRLAEIHCALAAKDTAELRVLSAASPMAIREALLALTQMYGDAEVLDDARRHLPHNTAIDTALDDLQRLASHLQDTNVTYDLADLRGYAYYSGTRFAMYVPGGSDALVRGGRYDEVGAVFGRNRPAVGFSLDVRELVGVALPRPLRTAIRAPWSGPSNLHGAIVALRASGEIVVQVLPGHESEVDEFHCDRVLRHADGAWSVESL